MFFASVTSFSEINLEYRKLVEIENTFSKVYIDLGGRSIVGFQLKSHWLNPLNWNYPGKGNTDPRGMGHFICFDRWGKPSEAEAKNGMPFHGEASNGNWVLLTKPVRQSGGIFAEMSCELPIAGLSLHRTLILDENEAVMNVKEEISNLTSRP